MLLEVPDAPDETVAATSLLLRILDGDEAPWDVSPEAVRGLMVLVFSAVSALAMAAGIHAPEEREALVRNWLNSAHARATLQALAGDILADE